MYENKIYTNNIMHTTLYIIQVLCLLVAPDSMSIGRTEARRMLCVVLCVIRLIALLLLLLLLLGYFILTLNKKHLSFKILVFRRRRVQSVRYRLVLSPDRPLNLSAKPDICVVDDIGKL